jgi:3-oxoacyl-[acyl-carrier-protein] synthase II
VSLDPAGTGFSTVAGMGILFCRGRGGDALERAAREGWKPPTLVAAPFDPRGTSPAFPVDLSRLGDRSLLSRLRRADRFSQLAVLAARDAYQDAGLDAAANERTGIIVATGLGPHVTTFRFLDEILTYGDQGPSALVFSHTVHNAAASYLASLLDVRGPAVTIAQTDFAFHEALLLAGSWLAEGRCDHVLVGTVEELGEVMRYACQTKCPAPDDGRLRPLSFAAQPRTVPGEGSFFFVLHRAGEGTRVRVSLGIEQAPGCDLLLLDADGMSGSESAYERFLSPDASCASYLALAGGMLTGTAFHTALATWMIRNRASLTAPDVRPGNGHAASAPRRIACIKLNCAGEGALVELAAPDAEPSPSAPAAWEDREP